MPTLAPLKPHLQPAVSAAIKRPWWQTALRFCLWTPLIVVFAVAALEGIFALAHIGEEEMVEPDPSVGFGHIPNKPITFRSEGYSECTTNSLGLRDVNWTLTKPAGTTRIAVLGDSMAEGYQVAPQKTYSKLLEKLLNRDAGGHYEVMNFGVSNYSTVQELYQFKNKILQYHPDVCIVSYHIGDCQKNMYTPDADNFLPRPYCQFDNNGRLVTNWSVVDNFNRSDRARIVNQTRWLRWHSRVWAVATQLDLDLCSNKQYKRVRDWVFSFVANTLFPPNGNGGRQPAATDPSESVRSHAAPRLVLTDAEVLGDPNPAPATDAPNFAKHEFVPPATGLNDFYAASWWNTLEADRDRMRATQAVLQTFSKLCAQHNCRLVVAALPAANNSAVFFRQLRYLAAQAPRDHFTFVDLNQSFPSLSPEEQTKCGLFFVVHFTEKGHALIAPALETALFKAGIVQ